MVTEFMINRVKIELGLTKEASKEQTCMTISRMRSDVRSQMDEVRRKVGELKFDPMKLLYMSDHESEEQMRVLKSLRKEYVFLTEELNELSLDASIVSCKD